MARRLLAALLVVVGAVAVLIAAPIGVAQAAPVNCGYPAAKCVCPTLSVSSTAPKVGEAITVTGVNFNANARVSLILVPRAGTSGGSFALGSARTNAAGNFSTRVVMPSATANRGNYFVKATSGFSTSTICPADPATSLTLSAAAGNQNRRNGQAQPSSNEPATAFTGLNVMWLLLLAGALVVAGGYANRRGKKNNTVRSARR